MNDVRFAFRQLLKNRGFTAGDAEGAAKVVVVKEAFARSYLPHENPIGQTLNANESPWQIIGVCGDAKYTSIKKETPPTVYFSFRQDRTSGAYCAVRTVVPPLSLVSMARKVVVAAVDPNVPLSEITTQAAVRDQSISQERLFATLCGALAALAVLLAGVGLYGLLAYNVARRTGEIGLRMALGATRGHIARTIVREALLLAGVGLALGVPTALVLARLIRSQLYGVEPGDPATLLGTAGALLVLAALAAWLPAHRAARVEPIAALRAE